jgi:hypothetical protein
MDEEQEGTRGVKTLSHITVSTRRSKVATLDKATRSRIENLRKQIMVPLNCSNCNTPIHEPLTGRYDTSSGVLCKNCFSDRLGDELEIHPVRPSRNGPRT